MWDLGKLPIPNRTVPVYFPQIPFFCRDAAGLRLDQSIFGIWEVLLAL